jgi:hypothetical protein
MELWPRQTATVCRNSAERSTEQLVLITQLHDIVLRAWDEVIARPSGPLGFRFIVQPIMASMLAFRDGYRDAIAGRTPYFWAVLTKDRRGLRLREGVRAVARVLIFGCAADAIYQFVELNAFRPLQMVVIAFLLAFIPYLLVRGPANHLVHWFKAHLAESNRSRP